MLPVKGSNYKLLVATAKTKNVIKAPWLLGFFAKMTCEVLKGILQLCCSESIQFLSIRHKLNDKI